VAQEFAQYLRQIQPRWRDRRAGEDAFAPGAKLDELD